mmetsp:Transcript_25380/g.71001  ORF Transcript_25380/g.71001 Transcript_25380/m.71001 type:complete len:278 (-) Transcript_25380:68-901(-)|eukprot:CAMPEP_0117677074 /NCGR_PEP_ID=MMETSP0804-20121206/16548_1 /TAXON_ID=1074897 /ORGANISM="Tetraselmis astigmatica, Strain CCMP880" /LENGTH=277 /DNA_ID=CAMNT_0005486327 /DNA_START=57 /DNA_END=890 /DNA_ORIENTATION=+
MASSTAMCRAADVRLSSAFRGVSLSARPSAAAPLCAPRRAHTLARRAGGLNVQARTMEVGVGVMGTKAGMTQVFSNDGTSCDPVTIIGFEDNGNYISMIKTDETDGYTAVQVGYKEGKSKNLSKPETGHLAKAGIEVPLTRLAEFKVKEVPAGYEVGQQLNACEMFKEGDIVDIAGTSTGKGFQGTIKRWNMSRGPMSHGSKSHRERGSVGASATPSRILPGLKMAGKMGNERVKVRKMTVLKVYPELNAIAIKGSLPGKPGGILSIAPAKIVGKNI